MKIKCHVCNREIWRFWCWLVVEEVKCVTDPIAIYEWCAECHAMYRDRCKIDQLVIFEEVLKKPGNDYPLKEY